MEPIENQINPRLSREILDLLYSRGWTSARVARTIRARRLTVDRVAASEESFTPQHVRALARALRVSVNRFLFDVMEPAALKSKERELWVATRRLLNDSETFRASLRSKPAKKRRARTKAA